ncbi:hypothetical protein H5410_010967 [Solanum commersonii]|uniref:Uncharacterized protein n=1 Tax=Solanum commersonii TaxID=4109 RepID=A0A9J6AM92_SOLCO|nr:hypothetical protein H5410_010967 [Solanum commersonii]
MKSWNTVFVPDPKSRSCICSLFLTLALICAVYFTGNALMAKDFRAFSGFTMNSTKQNGQCGKCKVPPPREEKQESHLTENVQNNKCQKKCRPLGSEALPEGIVSKTSNLEMRPLWGDVEFLEHDFVVMLFHYDGVVDEWNDLEWSNRAIHVSAMNQTKWWFAKRFLHPDIVSEYDYIFLWDEDLGVENFHPEKYISIVREEGLEISQPGLDASKSEVHHHITVRRGRSKVHRRFYRLNRGGRTCDNNSTEPPCVVRNDGSGILKSRLALCLVYGPERPDPCMGLGYEAWLLCAGKSKQLSSYFPSLLGMIITRVISSQGDRTKKVGVVDAEYITHLAVPSLGGNSDVIKELDNNSLQGKNLSDSDTLAAPVEKFDNRSLVRRQSYIEMKVFRERWRKAIKQDQCWVDPFQSQEKGKTGT